MTRRSSSRRVWWFCLLSGALLIGGAIWMLAYKAPEAHYRRALADIDGKRLESVAYELLGLPKNQRYEAQSSLLSGALLVASGETRAAPHVLAVAAANPDTEVRAMVLLGECLYKSDHFQEAGEIWTKALELDPDNADAHRWLGVAYYEIRAVGSALFHLQKAVDLDEHDPGPARLIGYLCVEYWEPSTAIDGFQEALRRAPDRADNDEIRYSLAKVYYRINQFQQAVDVLSQCAPSDEVSALMADCLLALGRKDEAWIVLTEVLRLNPQEVRALALKGKVLLERREFQSAAETLDTAAQVAPYDPGILYDLAIACQRIGDEERSADLQRRVSRLNDLRNVYEQIAFKIVDDPRDAESRHRLGILATQLGFPALARTWFEAAIRIDPRNGQARAALQALDAEAEQHEEPSPSPSSPG